MNRPGPQSLRGMPSGFGGQQQQQQPTQQQGRSASSRLPNGKIANNNNSNWAFNGAPGMASAGFQTQGRQMGGNISFAQSLSGGSQPSAPLDLSPENSIASLTTPKSTMNDDEKSGRNLPTEHMPAADLPGALAYSAVVKGEFPSLSNNPQLGNAPQSSLWSTASARNISAPVQQPGASQPSGQDDPFTNSTARGTPTQASFRFGNPGPADNGSGQTQGNPVDDFPPLNRSSNGETGADRTANLISSLGLGSIGGAAGAAPSNRGNGLLNALSANSRANEPRSPPGVAPPAPTDGTQTDEDVQRRGSQLKEVAAGKRPSVDNVDGKSNDDSQEVVDPLAGMSPVDKWGIKGLRTLMNNYPDYHAMVVGMDPSSLGLDLGSQDLISTQSYSLFDESLPKPTVHANKFRLPECYNVTNVQPIETKIQSFNEETLFWIFYSCPADVKQQMAAVELYSRNWRWHRKLQLWLTKDELMTPQILSHTHERGYYIVWDTSNWRKDRREITLHYADLETVVNQTPVGA